MNTSHQKHSLICSLLLLGWLALSASSQAVEVMSWAAPYNHQVVKARLQQDMGAYSVGDGLTILGLQFWTPSMDHSGGLEWAMEGDMRAAEVAWFVDWGKKTDTKVLLTVYNFNGHTKQWDWPLAKSGFVTHRQKFIDALIATVETHKLDGVDIDLEGLGDFDSDREAYKLFITELSAALKARNKMLTIDSFHSPCFNAPNMSWWGDWVGKVDLITSMGYYDLGEGSEVLLEGCEHEGQVFKYSYQQAYGVKLGYPPGAISLGMNGMANNFGPVGKYGNSILAHLREITDDLPAPSSVSIWDAQLGREANDWHKPETWEAFRKLVLQGRNQPEADAEAL